MSIISDILGGVQKATGAKLPAIPAPAPTPAPKTPTILSVLQKPKAPTPAPTPALPGASIISNILGNVKKSITALPPMPTITKTAPPVNPLDFNGFKDAAGNPIPISKYTPAQKAALNANNQAIQTDAAGKEAYAESLEENVPFRTIGELPAATGKTAVGIARAVPRALATVAYTADKGISDTFGLPQPGNTPKSTVARVLFGHEPIQSIGERGRELQTSLGQDPSKPLNKFTAPFFGLGVTLSDLLPLEGGEAGLAAKGVIPEEFINYLAEEKSPVEISKTLQQVGVGRSNAETLASQLAPTRTPEEVGDVLQNFSTLSKTAGEAVPKPETGPISAVARVIGEDTNVPTTEEAPVANETTSPIVAKMREYPSAADFEGAVKEKADTVFRLAGNSIQDISVIGSTANGKAVPNDLDILITPTKSLGPMTSETIHPRKEFNETVQKEIQDFFPNTKVHVTVSNYDAARGNKISLQDFYAKTTGTDIGVGTKAAAVEAAAQRAKNGEVFGDRPVPDAKKQVQIDLLHRQLQRTADSLRSAITNPVGHAKAYPNKTPAVYRARINELNAKIDALTGSSQATSPQSPIARESTAPSQTRPLSPRSDANLDGRGSPNGPVPQSGERPMTATQREGAPQSSNSSYNKNYPLNGKLPSTTKSMAELLEPVKTTGVDKTRAIPVRSSEIPHEFVMRKIDLSLKKEDIQNSPYKGLLKYIARSGEFQGHLPEVTGKRGGSYFAEHGDDIIQSAFPYKQNYATATDVEDVRAGMDKYLERRKDLFADVKQLNKDIAEWKAEHRAKISEERDQAFLDEEARKQARPLAQVMDEITPPIGRGGIQPPKLDFTKWKDKGFLGTLRMQRETLDRNIMDVMPPEQAAEVKKFLTDPIRKNETERTEFVNNERGDIKAKMKELGITARSKADELVQKVGEGKVNQEQVTKEAPGQAKAIMDGVTYFRKKYDAYLDKWNDVRKEFGYKPVPKREDYFRHFQEIQTVMEQIGAIGRGQDLPTEIAGLTHIFKPGKAYTNAELRRTGDKTAYSAMAGMDNYLDTVSKQIWSMDSIARADTLLTYIRDAARETSKYVPEERVQIPRIAENLQGVLDQLRYKKSTVDTGMQSVLGRGVYASAQLVKNRVAANMVGANIASALTNFIPVFTQLPATTGTKYFLQGLYEGVRAPLMKDNAMIDGVQSDFLRRRYPADIIAPTKTQKAINALGIAFKAVDEFAGYSIVSAKYHENISKGMSKQDAIKDADSYAAKVISDRSLAQMPNLFSHKTLGFFTQFQLETNNIYSFLKKDIPEMSGHNGYKIFKKLLAFAVASYLFNELYEKIAGRRPTLDPIYDILTLTGIQSGTKDLSVGQRAAIVGKDLAGNIPFGNMIPGIGGGRLPISSVVPKNLSLMELSRVLLGILPPVGGGQAFKTLKGAITYHQGYAETTAGKPSFPIEKNTANLLRELIFGPSSTPEADAYYKNLDAGSAKALNNAERPVYDHYQELLNAGKKDEAAKYLNSQYPATPEGDARYSDYVKVRDAVKAQTATENTNKYLTEVLDSHIVQKVLALQAAGKKAEADKLVTDAFPNTPEGDAKYDAYKTAKTMLKAADTGFGAKDTTQWDKQSFVTHLANVARGASLHPIQFFDNVFARGGDWRVEQIQNGQIIVKRMPEMGAHGSEVIRQRSGEDTPDWKLDHTVPREIGGSNRDSNLQMLTTAQWAAHTKVENFLGTALKNDEVTGPQAREYIIRYKAGIGEPMSDTLMKEYKDKYGSKPMTFEEIQAAVEGK